MQKLTIWISMAAMFMLAACSGTAGNVPQTGGTVVATVASGLPQVTTTTAVNAVTVAPSVASTTVATIAATTLATSAATAAAGPTIGQSEVSCSSPATVTPSLTEGPYWKQGSPERTSLLDPGVTGTKLVLTGTVLTTDCKPVAHAWVDFWQANAQGQYDNSGYTLRGHQFTDANGRYTLETIIPGLYPGRTEHIHVKVQAPNGPVLTTQLFFPGVAQNQEDGIFNASLVLPLQKSGDGYTATFNFVVNGQ